MREGISVNMLTLSEKALLVKLYYQNGESATAALLSYRHRKSIRTCKGPGTSSVVNRMISKFEAMSCLDDRLHRSRSSTHANVAPKVQEKNGDWSGFVYAYGSQRL